MSNYNINIGLTSSGSIGGALKSGAKDIQTLKKEAQGAGNSIGQSINKGVTVASSSFTKLKSSASNTFGMIKAGARGAADSLGDLGTAIGGIAGGFGAMEIAQSMWTGATTKQFNSMYLQTKMSSNAANDYIKQIQTIVAEVPGDDTYMNNLMTGAVAKQTNLSTKELKMLGIAAADYLTTSQAMGKSAIETQMDLKEYILTGNTSQLERDSILKNQMNTLEGQSTVSERILALNKSLKAEGYAGLSQLDIASIKWEEIKGKFQLAATTVGEKLLPYIEKFLDFMLDLDEKTKGQSTLWILIGGTIGFLALALAPVVGATLSGYYAMKNYRIEAERARNANLTNPGPKGGTPGAGATGAGGIGTMGTLGAGMILAGAGFLGGYGWEKLNQMGSKYTMKGPLGDLQKFGMGMTGKMWSSMIPGMGVITGLGRQTAGGEKLNIADIIPGGEIAKLIYNKVSKSIVGKVDFGKWHNNGIKWIKDKLNRITGSLNLSAWFSNGINWIKSKLNRITGSFSISSLGARGLSWLSQRLNITGSLNLSAWNNYAKRAIDAAAKSKGPAGPSSFIGHASGFTYQGYGGIGQSINTTLATGAGNCVDGTLAQMALAESFGIPSEMIATTWRGNPHVYARIGGQNRDIANHALTGSWNPPPRGPGGSGGAIIIYGDVYGYNDFVRKVEQANNRICRG